MNDTHEHPNSVDARLAVLESQVRALTNRVGEVSNRTHQLATTMQGVVTNTEEARDQRLDLIEKVKDIQGTINSLSTASATTGVEMKHHVRLCELRSARLEKLAWAAISALIAVLGFLGTPYLAHLPRP
jgi:uncharacterized protein YoxC